MKKQVQYCAVSAASSRHFAHRVYKTKKAEPLPGAFLRVMVDSDAPKREIIRHLELIKAWLIAGDNVQDFHPDTFFCELEAIPQLRVYSNAGAPRAKTYRARDTKGNECLV